MICRCSHSQSDHHEKIHECSRCDCGQFRLAELNPDAPTIVNENGGKQSELNVRFDLMDAHAMFRLASILDYGAKKYAPNNWRKISVEDNLNHALTHIYGYLSGDTQDDHLGHAFARIMFAIGVENDSE